MQELMSMLAGVLPKEKIADMVKKSAEDYLINPTEDSFNKLSSDCVLLLSKSMMGEKDGLEGAMDQIKEYKKAKAGMDLLSGDNEKSN